MDNLDFDLAPLAALRKGVQPPPPALEAIDIDLVPVSALTIDDRYQRRISRGSAARLRKIVKEFTWSRFGALIVARTDNGYALIDGQHRALAARAIGITEVPAVVVKADLVGQAMDFVGINTTRTSVASIDKFRARVTAGDPAAVEVNKILQQLEISTEVGVGYPLRIKQTRAVSQLEKLVKRIGAGEVFSTLELLLDAQPTQANLLTAFAIEVTAMTVHHVIEGKGSMDRLLEILKDISFEDLKDRAAGIIKHKGSGKQSQEGHILLMGAYNKNLQHRIT